MHPRATTRREIAARLRLLEVVEELAPIGASHLRHVLNPLQLLWAWALRRFVRRRTAEPELVATADEADADERCS